MSADEAGPLLERDIDEALASGEPHVIDYPAGTGKSFRSARSMTKLARAGQRVCYATQEHAVAHETRSLLPPDVYARSVHIHSPLVQVGREPVCRRAGELKESVFEYGRSLLGTVCPKCPFKDSCEALSAAKERAQALPDASIIFVSHAGINQVFGMTADGEMRGAGIKLLVDEMPSAFVRVEVTPAQLQELSQAPVMPSADAGVVKVVREIARAWLAGEAPGDVTWGLGREVLGNALALAVEWGRLTLREKAQPSPGERPLLRAADALVRLAAFHAAGGVLEGFEDVAGLGVSAMLPDGCHAALIQQRGTLLSATPMLVALPGFKLKKVHVKDGAPVRRTMILRAQRGSGALTKAYYDDELGCRVARGGLPGEEPGIPWPLVDDAIMRALKEADKYGAGARVLFVTFKSIADSIRETPERLHGGRIQVGHYGAMRGKNDWMEGKPLECSVVYCFGTPRQAIRPTLLQLGLFGQAADDAWVDYAAGELTQAEGRLRLPRRTKPCTVMIEGDVAPSSWHTENITDVLQEETEITATSALLELALLWRTQKEVSEALGVQESTLGRWRQPGKPPPADKHRGALERLASPTLPEALRCFSRATFRRQQLWLKTIEISQSGLDGE